MTIKDVMIGELVFDSDGSKCEVLDKTSNSIRILIPKKTNKGINSIAWFEFKNFNKRFEKGEYFILKGWNNGSQITFETFSKNLKYAIKEAHKKYTDINFINVR